jgi:hypothetical protein
MSVATPFLKPSNPSGAWTSESWSLEGLVDHSVASKLTGSAGYEFTNRDEDCTMRRWIHRVSYPSTALQYIGDIFLNLLIAGSGIALWMFSVFFFT